MTFWPWLRPAISVAALAAPPWLLYHSGDAGFRAVVFLWSGAAFADRPLVMGGALDQFSLHKELFLLGYSMVVLCPFLAVVRWLNSPAPRPVRLTFAAVSLLLLVHPFSILTVFSWDVLRYIVDMGVTPRRLMALAVACAGYAALGLFATWLWGAVRRRPGRSEFGAGLPGRDTAPPADAGGEAPSALPPAG